MTWRNCLVAMGASIHGAGTDRIVIEGVDSCTARAIGDAGPHRERHLPVRRGRHRRRRSCARRVPHILDAVIEKLREAGAQIEARANWIRLRMNGRPRAVNLRTAPYPAFPTDMQAQFMALNCIAEGVRRSSRPSSRTASCTCWNCSRLGAHIDIDGNTAIVRGVEQLAGATVMATDLRASASLVIAGLVARGRNADRPHLPPGPRLRADGEQAGAARREDAPDPGERSGIERRIANTIGAQRRQAGNRHDHAGACPRGASSKKRCRCWRRPASIALEDPETSRKLISADQRADVRVVIVRATDVPTYVQYGAADLGVAGKDVLLEHGGERPVSAAGPGYRALPHVGRGAHGFDYASAVRQGARLRVATKYVETAREHFAAKGVHVDLIKLYGSMELAPLVGPGRRHRRPGVQRRYAAANNLGRGGGDHGDLARAWS